MVIRMRSTRSHTANRRSHDALKARRFVKCENCGTEKMGHAICKSCGFYKGKQMLNVVAKAEKKAKKAKAKRVEAGK